MDASLWLSTKIFLVAQSQYPLSQIPLAFPLPSNPLPISTPAAQASSWNLSLPFFRTALKNFLKRFNTTMKRRFAVLRCYFSVFRITNLRKKFKGKWLSKVNSGLTAYLINLFTVNVHRHSSRLYQSSVTLTTWRDHTKITDLTRRWL